MYMKPKPDTYSGIISTYMLTLQGLQEQVLISYFELSLLKMLALTYYAWPLMKDVNLPEVRSLLPRIFPALKNPPNLSN